MTNTNTVTVPSVQLEDGKVYLTRIGSCGEVVKLDIVHDYCFAVSEDGSHRWNIEGKCANVSSDRIEVSNFNQRTDIVAELKAVQYKDVDFFQLFYDKKSKKITTKVDSDETQLKEYEVYVHPWLRSNYSYYVASDEEHKLYLKETADSIRSDLIRAWRIGRYELLAKHHKLVEDINSLIDARVAAAKSIPKEFVDAITNVDGIYAAYLLISNQWLGAKSIIIGSLDLKGDDALDMYHMQSGYLNRAIAHLYRNYGHLFNELKS